MQKYTWKLLGVTPTEVKIKLTFDYPKTYDG